jgi:hypothetical protein
MRELRDVRHVARDALHICDFGEGAPAVAAIGGHVKTAGARRRFVVRFPPHAPGEVFNRKGFELLIPVAGPRTDFLPLDFDALFGSRGRVLAGRAEEKREEKNQNRRSAINHELERILLKKSSNTEVTEKIRRATAFFSWVLPCSSRSCLCPPC